MKSFVKTHAVPFISIKLMLATVSLYSCHGSGGEYQQQSVVLQSFPLQNPCVALEKECLALIRQNYEQLVGAVRKSSYRYEPGLMDLLSMGGFALILDEKQNEMKLP